LRIAFATHAKLDGLTPSDQLAADQLSRGGATVTPIQWNATTDWRQFDAVVIRATWDYYTRPDQYLDWLRTLQHQGVPVWNPAPLAAWNMYKGYLRDLERAGIVTVPTEWVKETRHPASLERLVHERGWTDVVVKPAVSANADRTWRTQGGVTNADEARFSDLTATGEVMVQPLLETLVEEGEWSFVFLGGEFSHAVLKRPAPGDFRVQTNLGGRVARADARAEWVKQARAVLGMVQGRWLYARVDGCMLDGQFVLMELEMLEPDLFLNLDSQAPARFAEALLRLVKGER
jgi:glutathione synthase/RimK-type ligase-like ATP-grasp enzyme